MIADQIANQTKAQPEPVALFVSDTHLNPSLPKTTEAFLHFLRHHAKHVGSLYLLGDLFEYWAGDDNMDDPYNRSIVDALLAVHEHGVKLYWIAGNRDFLVSDDFADATGAQLLPDPSIIELGSRKTVITHGDALCTDDLAYMAFRQQVRQAEWKKNFLSMPLEQRKQIIEGLRNESKKEQQHKSMEIMDVNSNAVEQLFTESGTELMIHGHTHRPAIHAMNGKIRHVLPDWDCDTGSPRGGWLAAFADGSLLRYQWNGASEL